MKKSMCVLQVMQVFHKYIAFSLFFCQGTGDHSPFLHSWRNGVPWLGKSQVSEGWIHRGLCCPWSLLFWLRGELIIVRGIAHSPGFSSINMSPPHPHSHSKALCPQWESTVAIPPPKEQVDILLFCRRHDREREWERFAQQPCKQTEQGWEFPGLETLAPCVYSWSPVPAPPELT